MGDRIKREKVFDKTFLHVIMKEIKKRFIAITHRASLKIYAYNVNNQSKNTYLPQKRVLM